MCNLTCKGTGYKENKLGKARPKKIKVSPTKRNKMNLNKKFNTNSENARRTECCEGTLTIL